MNGFSHISALVLIGSAAAQAAAPTAEALKFFENKVRPILADQCQECHGSAKHKGGLRLDNLPYILQGGEGGPAIVPGQPDKSLLMKAISYTDKDLEMPPDGKMSDADMATLKQWIAMGAPWPEAEVASARPVRKPGQITAEDRQWWAFQPVKEPKVPSAKIQALGSPGTEGSKGPRNAIDQFVLAKLAENGLQPAPEADPDELIRRVSFDLTGLPPTPEEVRFFEA